MAECENCGTCGTGSGLPRPLPGDPSNDGILRATPAFGGIDINITYPSTNPFAIAHTILWRGTSSNFALARRHVDPMAGSFFYDKVDADITYYYWIQFVSVHGTVGDVIGPASAAARPLIADLIEQLSQQIDEGILSQALRAKLDQISTLNTNLLNEIQSRQNENISLGQAIADAQDGVAQALTFLIDETNDRVADKEALIERINGIAGTVGDSYAAIIQKMQVDLDENTGKTDALYTIHTEVDGYVGGYGISNNGQIVEAGFNVDTFWIGRPGAQDVYPFIVKNGEVFIKRGVIDQVTIGSLRNENGSIQLAPDGKIKGDYLEVNRAYGGSFSEWRWPANGGVGFYLGPEGLLLGNAEHAPYGYFQADRFGNVYTPNMTIVNGTLKIGGGKFTANPDGSVIADTVDIRRRIVVQSGTLDPTDIIRGNRPVYNSGEGSWLDTAWPVGSVFSGVIQQEVMTAVYDPAIHNSAYNQPYYAMATAVGSTRSGVGWANPSQIYIRVSAKPVPNKTFSHTGDYPNDNQVAIVFEYHITLVMGGFVSFRLPLINWTLYRL